MSKPKSNNLFHFTKSIDVLKSILKNGLLPRYCLEDMSWVGMAGHMAYPMVCFCDIPLSRIQEHTSFYGEYGIGLTKDWGLKNQLDPVIYCTNNGLVSRAASTLLEIDTNSLDENLTNNISLAFACFAKLTKPLAGSMYVGGSIVQKEFYQESEWRYMPREGLKDTVVFKDQFEKDRESLNNEIEKNRLELSPNDIAYIFVKKEADIPGLVDFINNNLGSFPLNDLKILYTRIVSLDTLTGDL
jgi:hypothetical protein